MKHLFGYNKQQVIADGNPNLRKDGILTCSIERFDMQPQLYPFEKIMESFP